MIISPSGLGIQNLFANAKPTFVWDAYRAGRSIGAGKDGSGQMPLTITDYDGGNVVNTVRWSDGKLTVNTVGYDVSKEEFFGPAGHFYDGGLGGGVTWSASPKLGMAVVTPTPSGSWSDESGVFSDIFRGVTAAHHCYRTYADTGVDVNDVVVERSSNRSTTYNKCYHILCKQVGGTDPTGIVELGWNATAGTRITEAPRARKLPGSDWYQISIIVPAGVALGYISVKVLAGNGIWEFAAPQFFNIYAGFEYVPRLNIWQSLIVGKNDVHTTNAELQLRRQGWLAMSVILPDRGLHNGHLDYAGAANYKFSGYLNLDCGTDRLRVSMSDTNEYLVVSLGTTAGVYYAYLDSDSIAWEDFAPLGIVATWEVSNGNQYATLYINGDKRDSVSNPATGWFSDNLAPGTLYVGSASADGAAAEAWIPRVAYGNTFMHRSYARTLSIQMRDWAMARGGSALDAWSVSGGGFE